MRNLFQNLALVAVAVAGAVSCTETDLDDNITPQSEGLVLRATTPSAGPDTKMGFTDEGTAITLEWEEGDEFTLYDSAGHKVDTFRNTDGDQFISSDPTTTLTDGETYTAKYNERVDLNNQDGDAIASLDNACQMEATFVPGTDEAIAFEHTMAIMTFKFRSDVRPAKLVFENGVTKYTVNYSNIEPVDGVYISHIMIKPYTEPRTLTLIFSLYNAGESEPYDARTVSTNVKYVKGMRYTSPLSELENLAWKGSGTETDPCLIESADQLRFLSDKVNSGNSYRGKHFVLTQNIVLKYYTPIGTPSTPFSGTFNGTGHKITIEKDSRSSDYLGFFGYTSYATIKNLNIEGYAHGNNYIGSLVGYAYHTTITSCSSNADATGAKHIGGLVGYAKLSTITSCSNAKAYVGVKGTAENIGGLVGYAEDSTITSCSTNTTVTGEDYYDGGIVGRADSSTITYCSSDSSISNNGKDTFFYWRLSGSNPQYIYQLLPQ